jgi:hypothetical protein
VSPDILKDIDFGQDFEDFAVGLQPVTVSSVDPASGAVLATASDVPAAKLVTMRGSVSARTGEVGVDRCEFWFRANRLDFTPKPRDLITDEGGTVWVIEPEGVQLDGIWEHALARCKTVKRR